MTVCVSVCTTEYNIYLLTMGVKGCSLARGLSASLLTDEGLLEASSASSSSSSSSERSAAAEWTDTPSEESLQGRWNNNTFQSGVLNVRVKNLSPDVSWSKH